MTSSSALQEIINVKCDNFINAVNDFRTLLPHPTNQSSIHSGEEGRYVEHLLMEFLRESLPDRVRVSTGFVVDVHNGTRSYQVDILVYDQMAYTPYLRYGEAVILPKEAVIAAISVKKNINASDIKKEVENLSFIGNMCGMQGDARPYLCLFAIESTLARKPGPAVKTVFDHVKAAYPTRNQNYSTNELIDSIIVLNEFYLKKKRWRGDNQNALPRTEVPYNWTGGNGKNRNIYLQGLLRGIMWCLDEGRSLPGPRPKKTTFPTGGMNTIGSIPICTEDRPYHT